MKDRLLVAVHQAGESRLIATGQSLHQFKVNQPAAPAMAATSASKIKPRAALFISCSP